jgi:nitroimidazol reductase NimA-like FMN-containing flavoprotein (pyridoxamine 5'-phosphate oxidase superfamily)
LHPSEPREPILNVRESSSWTAEQISDYLQFCVHPLRLSLIANGAPLIVPLWFEFKDGCLWCACSGQATVARLASEQEKCGFDVSDNTMPYRGVRGQGSVTLSPADGEPALRSLIHRYLPRDDSEFARWLLSRADAEVAIVIRPDWVTAWDFSQRMSAL